MSQPIIKVWCLQTNQSEGKLRDLHRLIVTAMTTVRNLGLKDESDMFVLFPTDMMSYGLGKEILIEITDICIRFDEPGAEDVMMRLAKIVGTAVQVFYPEAKIKCIVHAARPNQGTWTFPSQVQSEKHEGADVLVSDLESYPACDVCGTSTVRSGKGYKCLNCGNKMGEE